MDENNPYSGNTNWQNSNGSAQSDLPNSTAALVLGIISLVCSILLVCCYGWIPGIATSIIGLILGIGAQKTYEANPMLYTEKSYRNAKAGKLMSLISLIICILLIAVAVVFIAMGIALDAREHLN